MFEIGLDDPIRKLPGAKTKIAQDVEVVGNVGNFRTAFNLIKVFLGIGILATPASFQQIGIVGGVLGLMFVGILNTYTMKLQILAKNRAEERYK